MCLGFGFHLGFMGQGMNEALSDFKGRMSKICQLQFLNQSFNAVSPGLMTPAMHTWLCAYNLAPGRQVLFRVPSVSTGIRGLP